MKLTRTDAEILVPDGTPAEEALARTTHLAVGAHQDDLEFMALHGILECFDRPDRWFAGVTVTDGSGSPRSGSYAHNTDREMQRLRMEEQREAARLGRYSCQIQLLHPSSELKDPAHPHAVKDLQTIFELAKADAVYLHNPADTHDTHVACCLRSIEALRLMPADARPATVYGCEVWRDLDWLAGVDKVVLPLDDPDNLGIALAAVFDSQIAGGKRYDLAVQGRRLAHATFSESHTVDEHRLASIAVDLTLLMEDDSLSLAEFTLALIGRFEEDVVGRIWRMNSYY